MKRVLFLLILLSLGFLLALSPSANVKAQDGNQDDKEAMLADQDVNFEEFNKATMDAIKNGLKCLASKQNKQDGSWGGGPRIVATSQPALAMMANGNVPGRGKYGKNVGKAVEFILSKQDKTGFITESSRMYCHGFATLFLAEVYGVCQSEELNKKVKKALDKSINLICRVQDTQGGWNYSPSKGSTDISVTICQAMALRAAKNAGIKVKSDVIKKCIESIKGAANPDGGFSYRMPRSGGSSPPRSAAGVCILYAFGEYECKEVTNGIRYIEQNKIHKGNWFFYANYYAAHAMYQAGGKHWKNWWPKIRDFLVSTQLKDGSWQDKDSGGNNYSTGMALIILQIPSRYLPIVQR